YVIDVEPVVVRREEEVARQLAGEIRTLSKVAEVVLCKRSHKWVIAITQSRVRIVIGKIHTGMAIHGIHDYRDAMLVSDIDQLLEVRALAKPLVHPEISDREITPVDRRPHVGERHDFDRVDPEVAEIGHEIMRTIKITG